MQQQEAYQGHTTRAAAEQRRVAASRRHAAERRWELVTPCDHLCRLFLPNIIGLSSVPDAVPGCVCLLPAVLACAGCLPPSDMLAQLRAAQEEAARLKKELAVLQQQQPVSGAVFVWSMCVFDVGEGGGGRFAQGCCYGCPARQGDKRSTLDSGSLIRTATQQGHGVGDGCHQCCWKLQAASHRTKRCPC